MVGKESEGATGSGWQTQHQAVLWRPSVRLRNQDEWQLTYFIIKRRNTPCRQAGYPKPLGRTLRCRPESAIFSLPGSARCDSSETNTWGTRPASTPRLSYNSCQTDFFTEVAWCWWYTCGDTEARWNIHVWETQTAPQEDLTRRSNISGLQRCLHKTALQTQGKPYDKWQSSRNISSLQRRKSSSTHRPEQNARGGCLFHLSWVTVWV